MDHAIWHAVNRGVDEMLVSVAETVAKEQIRVDQEQSTAGERK
jgi:hypothetical protein